MKSPFPGMDPYIEASGLWEDFHSSLIHQIRAVLAAAVPEQYVVRTGERAYVVLAEEDGKDQHSFLPDVAIASRTSGATGGSPEAEVAVAEVTSENEPVTLRAFIASDYKENFIEIYELQPERRLITCIEVLSPSNKRHDTPGWELYLRKRQGLLLGSANLVEIDLLRCGQRMPMIDGWPTSPYTLLVARRERAPYCRVWPAHYLRPLPTIPVPLTRPDADVQLNLQPLVDAVYQIGRYHGDIEYSKPLQPPLKPEETAWLAQQLRTQ